MMQVGPHLHGGADVAQPHVHARGADASVRGGAHRLEERIVFGVEGDRKGRINDAAIDLRAKVCTPERPWRQVSKEEC